MNKGETKGSAGKAKHLVPHQIGREQRSSNPNSWFYTWGNQEDLNGA